MRIRAFRRFELADQLAGPGVDFVPIILQVAADHHDLAVRGDLGTFAAFAVQRHRPDHLVGAHVDRAQAAARGDIDQVGDRAGGHSGDLFRAHAGGIFPGWNALDEAIIVVGVEHHDAHAIQPAGPLERTRQRDIDQMPAAGTETVIGLGGPGRLGHGGNRTAQEQSGRKRHVGLSLISIPPNETTLRMILSRLFVGDGLDVTAEPSVPLGVVPRGLPQNSELTTTAAKMVGPWSLRERLADCHPIRHSWEPHRIRGGACAFQANISRPGASWRRFSRPRIQPDRDH